MPYSYSESQRRFLRRKYAKEAALAVSCDCPGCDNCEGFIKGCECDYPPSKLKELLNERQQSTSNLPPF